MTEIIPTMNSKMSIVIHPPLLDFYVLVDRTTISTFRDPGAGD